MKSLDLLPVAAVIALCGACLLYLGQWRAQRRLRHVMQHELSRIFQRLDSLRLEGHLETALSSGRGDSLQPIARFDLGRDEARILLAMQNATVQRASAARATL
jgi:hypothetical protein